MRNTRTRGGFLGFVLGLLFGVIITVGGIVGAGFFAYKKVKVGSIVGGAVNEELSQLSIEKFIKEMSATFKDKENLTLGKLEEMLPVIGDMLPDEGISFGTLVKLDFQKLKTVPLSSVMEEFPSAIVITATLSSLETDFGAVLPDMPFIRGGQPGKEVWSYVPATEEDGEGYTLKENYVGEKELYVKVTTGEPAVTEYVIATELSGEEYVVMQPYENQELWYKTNGLMDVNIIDAVSALSSSLDVDNLTLRDMETKFGISLKQGTGEDEYHPIIEKLLDKKVTALGEDMQGLISDLYLIDVLTIEEGDVYLKAICFKRDADGDLLGIYDDGTTEIEVKVDANGIPLDATYGVSALPLAGVKVGEIEGQVNNVRLKDFLGDKYDEDDKIMSTLGEKTLGQFTDLDSLLEDLYLTDVLTVEEGDVYLKAICYKRDVDGDLLGLYADGTTEIEVKVDENGVPLDSIYGTEALPFIGVKITDIEDQINNVRLKDFLGDKYDEDDKIMAEIGEKPLGQISDLDSLLDDLYLTDVLTVEEGDVYLKAICFKRDADGDLLGVYASGTTEIEVKVDENGVPFDPIYGTEALPLAGVKISGIEEQINNVRLKDFLGDKYDEDDKIMAALGEKPISQIDDMDGLIADLYLADVITVGEDDVYLKAICYKRNADGVLLGIYDDGTTEIEVEVDENGVPLDSVYGTEPLPLAGVKIDEIEQQVNNVRLKDFLGDKYDEDDKIMAALGEKPISQIDDMDGLIADLYLADVITVGDDDVYLKAICFKRDADGDLLGVYDDGTTEIEVKVDANGVPLDPAYGTAALPLAGVKIAEIEQQVNNVRLKDFLGDQYDESNKIMAAIGETPLGQIGAKIEALTLVDVMSMENGTVRALAYQKADNGSGEYWYVATDAVGTTYYFDPAEYGVNENGEIYAISSGTPLSGYKAVPAALSDVAAQVEHLIVRECMEFDSTTPHLMYEVADVPIGEIGHALYNMDMRKVLGDEHLTGYIRASKQATRAKEMTGVAVGEWYILPSFEYYFRDGVIYSKATADQINAKQYLYTFDTTYNHYVPASKIAASDGEVDGVSAGEWYILPDHEYWYSADGNTFTKATAQQIADKENLYVHDLLSFWHFVFHQEDTSGNEIVITINNIGESIDHISSIFSEAKIGLLYDRGILQLSEAPLEAIRNLTVNDVVNAATQYMEMFGGGI